MPEDIVIITGPTAVGKTEIAVCVAERLGGEIVSADSMAIYKGMEVATAKPSPQQRQRVPHHLIDIVTPDQLFTVADYRRRAIEVIQDIRKRGKIPLVVGGTRLYIKALTSGFFPGPGSDPSLRQTLEKVAQEKGSPYLHQKLGEVDPEAANRLHPNDRKRIIRALEVYYLTGQPISKLQEASQQQEPLCQGPLIALVRDRSRIYERINQRVDQMIAEGLVEEVKKLLEQGLDPKYHPSLQGHGYKEIIGYLRGQYSFEEAVRILKRNTRHYAKRQLSWLRQEPEAFFVDADRPKEEVVERILKIIRSSHLL